MAIVGVGILGAGLRAAQSSWATASWAPVANRLYLFAVCNWINAGPATTPTVSGNSLTWVQVATTTISTIFRLTLFRALGAAPTAGVSTIDFGGVNQGFTGWVVGEFTGVTTSGTNGSGAIVQAVTHTFAGVSSDSITLAAFSSVNNGTYGVFWPNNTETASTPGSGFTSLNGTVFHPADGVDGIGVDEWRADNDTTVDASWSPNVSNGLGVAVELAMADVPGGWSLYRPYTLGSAIAAVTTGGLFYYWRRRRQERPDE